MFFQNPTYLWALLGLLIPLAIHLWSKKEGKTIKIGSIKLLSEADSKQSSSIRLNEVLLLLLRLAIVGLLVLVLAEPSNKEPLKNSEVSYLVEPSLLNNVRIAKMIDSLQDTATVYRFESGLTELEDTEEIILNSEKTDYWKWMREAEELKTDSLVVFSEGYLSGLKGRRPALKKPFEVILMSLDEAEETVLEVAIQDDKLRLLKAQSDATVTNVKTEEFTPNSSNLNGKRDSVKLSVNGEEAWVKISEKNPLKVAIKVDPKYKPQAEYLKAAFNVVSKLTWREIELAEIDNATQVSDVLIWLSEEATPSVDVKTLSLRSNELAHGLVERGDSEDQYYLTETLNAENIIDKDLVESLIDFLGIYSEAKERMITIDQRIAHKSDMTPDLSQTVEAEIEPQTMSMSKWLWIAMFILIAGERLLANFRKQ